MITPGELLERVRSLNTWKRDGERAPHKPLLLLFALGRIQNEQERLVAYPQVDDAVGHLLREFGPPRRTVHPEFPFWYLQNDDLWIVRDADQLERRKGKSVPTKGSLLEHKTPGGLPEDVYSLLEKDEELRRMAANSLLWISDPNCHLRSSGSWGGG